MVDRKNRCDAVALALTLILVGAYRHYAWAFVPPEMRGLASKALGAAAALVLLWIIAGLVKHAAVSLAAALWAFHETQVVVCTAWFAVEPWPVRVGEAMCSAKAGIDLGALGVMFVAFALRKVARYKP